ncbi:MAG: PD40 domain-containing protein [Chloroflexi bacterium]|nr:PD40 domain-containing protein [Chloroflexota bacterium]
MQFQTSVSSARSGNTQFDIRQTQGSTISNRTPHWSPSGQYIAFESTRSGNPDIWIMDADGSNPFNLTQWDENANQSFSWSPDGRQIAFTSQWAGSFSSDIWLVNSDGTEPINLSAQLGLSDGYINCTPLWSPDGNSLAFFDDSPSKGDIKMVSLSSFDVTVLTGNLAQVDMEFTWSPDSQRIAVSSLVGSEGFRPAIWMIDVESLNSRDITISLQEQVGSEYTLKFIPYVDWSPTGSEIAFAVSYMGANLDIFVASTEGNGLTNLTSNLEGTSTYPVWSPDGSKIAFHSEHEGSFDVWVMDQDGANQMGLTSDNNTKEWFPAWSPDGKRIAFEMCYESCSFGGVNGPSDIWIMDADGSNKTNLTGQAPQ